MIRSIKIFFILLATASSVILGSSQASAADVRRIQDTVPFRVFPDGKYVDQIVFRPGDSSVAIVAYRENDIALVDVNQLSIYWAKSLARYKGPLEFSHNGQILAVRDGGDLLLLNVDTGSEIRRFSMKAIARSSRDEAPEFVKFNGNDTKLFVASASEIFLVDIATGAVEQEFRAMSVPGSLHFIRALIWTSDERFLFAVTWKGLVSFNLTSGKYIRTVDIPTITGLRLNTIRDVSVTNDGAYTAISQGMHVYLVDNQMQVLLRRVLASSADIQDLNLTDDQCCFIVASLDGTSRVYDIASGEQLTRLDDSRPPRERASLMSSASPGRLDLIATGDANGILRMWRPSIP